MSSQPPRRGQPDDTEDDGGRRLPMFPIFAGVIVAGLGIGALLSAFAARHAPAPTTSQPPLVVTVTPTPVVEHPYSPPPSESTSASIAQTPKGAATATATAVAAASSAATPLPKASATATPSPRPSASSTALASGVPSRAPSSSPLRSVAAASPRAVVLPSVSPPAAPLAPPVNPPAAATRVAQSTVAPAGADPIVANAQSVVRRFLDAVSHGDQAGANAALGGSGGRLSEEQYLDPTTRITSMTSLRTSGGTKVEVELTTAKGQYFSTFTVQDTPKGAIITSHATIPVGGTTAR